MPKNALFKLDFMITTGLCLTSLLLGSCADSTFGGEAPSTDGSTSTGGSQQSANAEISPNTESDEQTFLDIEFEYKNSKKDTSASAPEIMEEYSLLSQDQDALVQQFQKHEKLDIRLFSQVVLRKELLLANAGSTSENGSGFVFSEVEERARKLLKMHTADQIFEPTRIADLKAALETQVLTEQKSAALFFEMSAKSISDFLFSGLLQDRSGSMSFLYSILNSENFDAFLASSVVMIFIPGRMFPGFVVQDQAQKWHLYGLDFSLSGKGQVYFGKIEDLATPIRIVDARSFLVIHALEENLVDLDQAQEIALQKTAEDFEIPLELLETQVSALSSAGEKAESLDGVAFSFGKPAFTVLTGNRIRPLSEFRTQFANVPWLSPAQVSELVPSSTEFVPNSTDSPRNPNLFTRGNYVFHETSNSWLGAYWTSKCVALYSLTKNSKIIWTAIGTNHRYKEVDLGTLCSETETAKFREQTRTVLESLTGRALQLKKLRSNLSGSDYRRLGNQLLAQNKIISQSTEVPQLVKAALFQIGRYNQIAGTPNAELSEKQKSLEVKFMSQTYSWSHRFERHLISE